MWCKTVFHLHFSILSCSFLSSLSSHGAGGALTFTKIVRGCTCRRLKIWLSLYQFLLDFPLISIPFSKEKHPILNKLGAFYNNLPKIHPIYVIWAPSSLMKLPPDCYTRFCKKAPQKADTYMYNMSMWELPPPRGGWGPVPWYLFPE